jgi:hypothetical protein
VTALLLLALAAAPCDLPETGQLHESRQQAACALVAQPVKTVTLSVPLESIYARPDFENARRRNTGALRAYLAQLRAWLLSFFESAGAEAYSDVIRFVVLLAGSLLALAVVLRLMRRRRARAVPALPRPGTSPLALEDPATHLSRAQSLLASAPREAIREALLSLLSHLERQRLARPDRVKTNRELAAELPTRGAPAEVVVAVTSLLTWYDATFYSLEPVDPAQAGRFLADVAAAGQQVAGAGAP